MKVPGGQAADQFVRVGLFGIYPQLQLALGKEGSEVAGLSQASKKRKAKVRVRFAFLRAD